MLIHSELLLVPNGARDEPHPQGADVPEAQTRRSGARRSRVASAASDVGSIEQLGGYDVAPRPSRGTGTKTSSKLTQDNCSMASRAPLGRMRAQRVSVLTILPKSHITIPHNFCQQKLLINLSFSFLGRIIFYLFKINVR